MPVKPTRTGIPKPEDYGFGPAVTKAQGDEVVAYQPRLQDGRLVVPLTVSNKGRKRAAYKVIVTVKGTKRTVPAHLNIPFVYPSTTWPTQVDVTAAGGTGPKNVKVTVKATKKEDRWS
ncbi:hypothetical protein [Streptomyces sp. YIM 121038]|uniref:hypothetical protein n=1 Tax=Streptomyces sp. YIM 121038 TaxID=2136401 RepID=UPI00111064D6|nr:hypothetical protein [Streptomyces sp. YIM 121038]